METWNLVRDYAVDNNLEVKIMKHDLGNDDIDMYEYVDVPISLGLVSFVFNLNTTNIDSHVRLRSDGFVELYVYSSNKKLLHLNTVRAFNYSEQLQIFKMCK